MARVFQDNKELNELIFESRNKDYGAYMLRKKYNAVVTWSIIAAVLIGSLTVIIPYVAIITKSDDIRIGSRGRYVQVEMEKLRPPEEEILIPPAAPPPPVIQQSIKYVAPVVVDTVLPTEKSLPTVAEVQASPENTTEELIVSSGTGQEELFGETNGEGGDEPFIIVEVQPSFRGGDLNKFRDWVQKRVVYPQKAQENGIQGRVYLTFIVERDGSVTNVNVVRGIDKLLDDEAKKAIESSPKWSPGLQRGRPVRVRFSISLIYAL
jgi:protein TonB